MRPLRFLCTVATCVLAFFFLIFIGPWRTPTEHDIQGNGRARSPISTYFNWRTPSSLFPPSAIISLTDDNSTFFLARPAAFGPLLPAKSLSGQLWIGSGFGEDHIGRGGGSGASAEGELGCSDVPGWNDDGYWTGQVMNRKIYGNAKSPTVDGKTGSSSRKRSSAADESGKKPKGSGSPAEDDGTDDYLHHPLPASDGLKTNGDSMGSTQKPTHADIQSLQESAEIAGKIVLLSRGGCGFLEKVKWVQRRGGIALIVGDDVRGGPLVTMYARGDTSNVTIPSLFTSHTTAHLLSSLIPAGHRSGDILGDVERLGLALADLALPPEARKHKAVAVEKPNFTTTTTPVTRPTSTPKAKTAGKPSSEESTKHEEATHASGSSPGWFWYLFGGSGAGHSREDSRRPPSSGHIGWILQEDFEEDIIPKVKTSKTDSTQNTNQKSPPTSHGDDFVIGVQDWRDPDLVAQQREQLHLKTASTSSSSAPAVKSSHPPNALKGGSITPGSGEYAKANHPVHEMPSPSKAKPQTSKSGPDTVQQHERTPGWLSRLFRGEKPKSSDASTRKSSYRPEQAATAQPRSQTNPYHLLPHDQSRPPHDGLWVTLSPTSVSSSPFFDTLLVLVVSPLVTLTVVYALLLLRSRIRRRRWRAPKSIVERLPVRTYHTMPSSTSASSTTTSSTASPINSTTPLLPHAPRPIDTRSRPRARTASAIPHRRPSIRSDPLASLSPDQIEEKRASGLAEWRRRYGGKQRECVVCLEEYVDGVSRVMSLPCGHEFHAECITPWLTTRRRTCPICKGDVVRSMARSSGSPSTSPTAAAATATAVAAGALPAYHANDRREDDLLVVDAEDEEEDVSDREYVDGDPRPAPLPVSREDEAFEDLERGMGGDRTQ